MSVCDYLNQWFELYASPKLAESTKVSYKMNIDKYISPVLGGIKLQVLKPINIQRFYNLLSTDNNRISKSGLSSRSIRYIHTNLNAALNQAVKLDLIRKNPANAVELPKKKSKSIDIPSEDIVKKMLSLAKDTDMELALNIEIGLGLRRGELLSLQWKDIQWDNSKLTINKNIVYVNNTLIVKEPKTEKSNRTIEIPVSLLNMLKKHFLMRKEEFLKLGKTLTDKDIIICKPDGHYFIPRSFSRKFVRFLEKNNLTDGNGNKLMRFHDLRHVNASLMVKYGINPKVAQKRMGHASISTTMDIYSHVLEEVEILAAARFDEEIFKDMII